MLSLWRLNKFHLVIVILTGLMPVGIFYFPKDNKIVIVYENIRCLGRKVWVTKLIKKPQT